jgi:hypothetical protein
MKKLVLLLHSLAFVSMLHAAASSDSYNFNGATHNLQCIKLNKSSVQLYDGAGNPLGLIANNKANSDCANSALRFQGMEAIVAGGRTYYYSWGLGGSDGQSGHIWISDMVSRPVIDANARGGSGGLFNGRSAPDITLASGATKSYFISPQPIPSAMHYVGPGTGLYYSYGNYGTPGSPYGTNYTNLSWSWINKTGGGIVRCMMKSGEVFYPSDVSTITLSSYDSNGVANGSVKAMYGSIWNGSQRIYGWMVHSHHYGTTYVEHIVCRTCQ